MYDYPVRTLMQWLDDYGSSHQHPANKLLHWICVPLIVLSILGLLWTLPVPAGFAAISPWLNWSSIVASLAVVYYATLSPSLAVGIAPVFFVMLWVVRALSELAWPLWKTCLLIFTVAWIGQFIGHAIEGKRPSFFKDVQFLLIGPLWLLAFVYRSLGLR